MRREIDQTPLLAAAAAVVVLAVVFGLAGLPAEMAGGFGLGFAVAFWLIYTGRKGRL